MTRLRRLLVLMGAAAVLAACTPHFPEAGAGHMTPTIDDGTFLARDGTRLPMRAWRPDHNPVRTVILALHGFNDYSNAFAEAGPWLAAEGIAVYTYDQRGFGRAPQAGRWPGTAALLQDLRDAVAVLRARHPDARLVLLGESMGGALAITALAAADPPPVDAAVLAAPAVWGRSTMPWYQRLALAVAVRIVPGLKLSPKGLGIWPSDNVPMLIALANDPLIIKKTRVDAAYGLTNLMDAAYAAAGDMSVPVLWLYGRRDEVVPAAPTLNAARRLDPAKGQVFVLYPNGWHMLLRDLQGERVLRDIAAWAKDPSAPLPSRAAVDPAEVTFE